MIRRSWLSKRWLGTEGCVLVIRSIFKRISLCLHHPGVESVNTERRLDALEAWVFLKSLDACYDEVIERSDFRRTMLYLLGCPHDTWRSYGVTDRSPTRAGQLMIPSVCLAEFRLLSVPVPMEHKCCRGAFTNSLLVWNTA